jgi:hypothetical protein
VHIADLRQRYRTGARTVRVVRLYDPDGGVRVIDFDSEARAAARALAEVRKATAARDRAIREATERWEAAVARAVDLGQSTQSVAEAADVSPSQVRAAIRRRSR